MYILCKKVIQFHFKCCFNNFQHKTENKQIDTDAFDFKK